MLTNGNSSPIVGVDRVTTGFVVRQLKVAIKFFDLLRNNILRLRQHCITGASAGRFLK